jgi:hypothetical protein
MIGGTPFVPTGSEGYGAQGGSKAPRSIARRHRSHAQPALAGEHGEEPPFDATEHRGTGIVPLNRFSVWVLSRDGKMRHQNRSLDHV